MAQTGYTPIQLYVSTTPAAAPSAGNLVSGELAINTSDEVLYFKNAAGTVKALARSSNVSSTTTGSGALVFATSPTLVTPTLTSPTLTSPNLGTPSALTLTNATGLPLGGLTGLGSGVATFLATPSSSNLASAVTGETGSGALVFATSPTLVTPNLGTPSAGDLSNCTGTASGLIAGSASTSQAVSTGAGVSTSVTTATNTGGVSGDVTIGPGLGYNGGSPDFSYFGRLILQNCDRAAGTQSMTLGSSGPAQAQPTVQGWIRFRIAGSATDRYIPYW